MIFFFFNLSFFKVSRDPSDLGDSTASAARGGKTERVGELQCGCPGKSRCRDFRLYL